MVRCREVVTLRYRVVSYCWSDGVLQCHVGVLEELSGGMQVVVDDLVHDCASTQKEPGSHCIEQMMAND